MLSQKGFLKRFVFLLSFIFILNNYLYSEDSQKQDIIINLNDVNLDFPVLKAVYDSGFFDVFKNNANYLLNKESKKIYFNGIHIQSNIEKKDNVEYVVFDLFSQNKFNQKIKYSWRVRAFEADDIFNNGSALQLIDLAIEAKDKNVNEVILEKALESDELNSLKIVYEDKETKKNIKGYELNLRSRPSESNRFWRALAEVSLCTGIGVVNYWIAKDENMEDWEYKPTKDGFKNKILDGWSFDKNAFRTNTVYHIYSGGIFYQIGRSNEYGYAASVVWSFAGSLFWEYIGEFREQVSMNDMVITTMGGSILGEALRISSLFVEKQLPKGFLGFFVACILDPIRMCNEAIDNRLYGDIDVSLQFLDPAHAILNKTMNRSVGNNFNGYATMKF